MEPVDTVTLALELTGALRLADLLALWADDGVLELPYAPDGLPDRLEGKAAIEAFQTPTMGLFSRFSMEIDGVYATSEPGVVFAEYRSDAEVAHNGRPYRNRYVARFEVRDGLLVRWREYFDPAAVGAAFSP